MQQPMSQQQDQMGCQQVSQQMVLCPVRLVYETQILVPPGDQVQPNQTFFINPQNPPPWMQNRSVPNQVVYVQQLPNNIVSTTQQPIDQNQFYLHQNFGNFQLQPQMLAQNPQDLRSAMQLTNLVPNMVQNLQQSLPNDRNIGQNIPNISQMQSNAPNQVQNQINLANVRLPQVNQTMESPKPLLMNMRPQISQQTNTRPVMAMNQIPSMPMQQTLSNMQNLQFQPVHFNQNLVSNVGPTRAVQPQNVVSSPRTMQQNNMYASQASIYPNMQSVTKVRDAQTEVNKTVNNVIVQSVANSMPIINNVATNSNRNFIQNYAYRPIQPRPPIRHVNSNMAQVQPKVQTTLQNNTNMSNMAQVQPKMQANMQTNTNMSNMAQVQPKMQANMQTNANMSNMAQVQPKMQANMQTNTNMSNMAQVQPKVQANMQTNANMSNMAQGQPKMQANMQTNTNISNMAQVQPKAQANMETTANMSNMAQVQSKVQTNIQNTTNMFNADKNNIPQNAVGASPSNFYRQQEIRIDKDNNNPNRKRKSESPDEIQKKIAVARTVYQNYNVPNQSITVTKLSNEVGVNTSPVHRTDNKKIVNKCLQINPNSTHIVVKPPSTDSNVDKNNMVPDVVPTAANKSAIPAHLIEKEKLIRNTVFTQARGRLMQDKMSMEDSNPAEETETKSDSKVVMVENTNHEINNTMPSATKALVSDSIDVKEEKVPVDNLEVDATIKKLLSAGNLEDVNKDITETKEIKFEEFNKIPIKPERDFNILTHVVDGYVIQESNIAFPIRKPLKEKTIYANALTEGNRDRNRDDFKLPIDLPLLPLHYLHLNNETVNEPEEIKEETKENGNPFCDLQQTTVKSWTTEDLAEHLSKFKWKETVSVLQDHEIDGESLFLVSRSQLITIGVPENHAELICEFVKS